MAFSLEQHDPASYQRKARIISVAMAGQLIIFGLLFSMLLTTTFGSSVWLNALGVLLGLLATSAMFAALRERPWMTEVRYVWQLKHHLSRISSYLQPLRRAVEEDNRLALDILTFYHQGMAQLAELNGRTTDDDAERLAEKMQVKVKREALGLPKEVTTFDPHDLSAFKQK
ncbi:hypothetical protein AWR38_24025 [Idiomarina sp. WRN-38]|jgi:hypothetical protein|uniref:DUF3087 domain-containing protein n=1 Tax=Vreelandella aquamarina TaxID=77097 RepID=A0A1H8L0X8_9GAMM|nr:MULTISPECIES: DUF3087 family protein [Halomonas]KTG23040.1 hypothetical protein AUR68_23985 [Idiomarina sp. H105]OAE89921.1 hypothetical protein AWR38_24025 [Idiomarina sp. WRN-38]HBK35812.1 DUF3087 domain-containing protein [Halomonas sp.]MCC4290833.1 DUF3087 domain-containing protein [Halomonas axialensis]MCF2912396.1 DUF3087 domain-containing protein [Halomonas sp. Cn5-12]|tara:strand:+ start:1830 stop:2342 length:513 start_codon:yes stop_codon:yes gene_type:complete